MQVWLLKIYDINSVFSELQPAYWEAGFIKREVETEYVEI